MSWTPWPHWGWPTSSSAFPKTGGNLPKSLSQFQDAKYKDMGGLKEPKQEAIAEVGPDLVIVANRTAKSYQDFSSKFTTIDMTVKPQGASATAAASPTQGGQGAALIVVSPWACFTVARRTSPQHR